VPEKINNFYNLLSVHLFYFIIQLFRKKGENEYRFLIPKEKGESSTKNKKKLF
jgi:hypothetical protein